MPEDLYSDSTRQQVCFPAIGIIPSTSRIADYQETRARVSFAQSLEFILSIGLVQKRLIRNLYLIFVSLIEAFENKARRQRGFRLLDYSDRIKDWDGLRGTACGLKSLAVLRSNCLYQVLLLLSRALGRCQMLEKPLITGWVYR